MEGWIIFVAVVLLLIPMGLIIWKKRIAAGVYFLTFAGLGLIAVISAGEIIGNEVQGILIFFSFGLSLLIAEGSIGKGRRGMGLGIYALCFSFSIPLVSFICGGIGYKRAKEDLKNMSEDDPVAKNINLTAIYAGISAGLIATTIRTGKILFVILCGVMIITVITIQVLKDSIGKKNQEYYEELDKLNGEFYQKFRKPVSRELKTENGEILFFVQKGAEFFDETEFIRQKIAEHYTAFCELADCVLANVAPYMQYLEKINRLREEGELRGCRRESAKRELHPPVAPAIVLQIKELYPKNGRMDIRTENSRYEYSQWSVWLKEEERRRKMRASEAGKED